MKSVAIVDYGMGNLRSVANALKAVGAEPQIVSTPRELPNHSRIIVPGVGAFAQAIAHLHHSGFAQALEQARCSGIPLLGICLGMQLFCRSSDEDGKHQGLGWIDATVSRFPPLPKIKVPHIGWDDVSPTGHHPLLEGISENTDFYFVHSHYVTCSNPTDSLLSGHYGVDYCAAFARNNVAGLQFHPEKSQQAGLKLLANFIAWKAC